MSIANIPTNFVNLVEPRQLRTNIFTPSSASNGIVGPSASTPSFSVLQGSIGAGSAILNLILCSPQGFSSTVTYTVSISGANAAYTGDVASFQGNVLWKPLAYLCSASLGQDSFFVVSAVGTPTTTATPNVMVQYLD